MALSDTNPFAWTGVFNTYGALQNYTPSSPAPAPAPTIVAAPTPAPAPVPPHLQFSANVVGSVIPLLYGTCRTAGNIIWAAGIDATSSVLDTSYLTFTACFGEPINPEEPVQINRMWANGTLFYDIDQGGVISVANITSTEQAALATSVASLEYSGGGPGATPSVIAESYLGAGNVPAYRGLRIVTFQDFPLSIAANSVPNVSVEWKRTDVTLVNPGDAIGALIARYLERIGYQSVSSSLPNYFPALETSGCFQNSDDDPCYGLVISDQGSIIDFFNRHQQIYRFQVVDGSPVRLVRRAVDADLSIDLSVDETDLIRRNAPTLQYSRVEPTNLPICVQLQYLDPANFYDTRTEPAYHEGDTVSSAVLSLSSDFIVGRAVARDIAYGALYDIRYKALSINFEIDDIRPEVSDIIAITTVEGDVYTCLVKQQVHTKTRSSQINAVALLTSTGISLNSETLDTGSANKKYWPEEVMEWDFIVGTSSVWSIRDATIAVNSIVSPLRKIAPTRWRDMQAKDPTGLNWGGDNFYAAFQGPGMMFEDSFYVYWVPSSTATISRALKTETNINTVETIVIPEGFYVDGSGTNDNTNETGNQISVFKDGKLYIAWSGHWNGVHSPLVQKLIVIDVAAWSASAFTAYDYETGSTIYQPVGIAITDNDTVIIATITGPTTWAGRYYYASVGSLGTWSHLDASFPLSYNQMASSGNKAYFHEIQANLHTGPANKTSQVAIVDVSGAISETVVDLNVQDANYLGIAQVSHNNMWVSDSHLFVCANHWVPNTTDSEDRYIGRFALSGLTSDGGRFLSELLYNQLDFFIRIGHYQQGKVYLALSANDKNRDSFVQIGEDLDPSSLTFWWLDTIPDNNDFATPKLLFADDPQTNDLTFANTETGEPVPSYFSAGDANLIFNNGHSVWYKFTPSTPGSYEISVLNGGSAVGQLNGIVVYTGTALGSLTEVASQAAQFSLGVPNTLTFTALGGTDYRISIRRDTGATDAEGGAIENLFSHDGKFTITVSAVASGTGVSIITEDGDDIITEDGADDIITEG